MNETEPTEITSENDPSGLSDDDLLSQARQEFSDIVLREKQPRAEYERCTRFLSLEQWNPVLVESRGWQVPSLVVDQLGPIKSQIVNDWVKNRMGILIGPGDEDGSEETAKVFSGYVRNIEYLSKGIALCDMGFGHMVGGNQGYIGLLSRRKPGTVNKFELFIRGFEDPMAVYMGRFTELDQSDLYEAFKRDCLSESEFKRQYPKAEVTDFDSWGNGFTDWYNSTKKEVALAEWWKVWFKERKLHLLSQAIKIQRNGSAKETDTVYEDELPEDGPQQGLKIIQSVNEDERIVMQYLMTGREILSRTRWLGKNIPIFQFKGRTYYVNGEKRMFSAISPALDSQAQLNYAESGIAEQMGSTVHTPWIGPLNSFKSRMQDWQMSAIKRFPFLEYDPVVVNTPNGAVLAPPPQRQRTEAEIQSYLEVAVHAANNLRFTTGITKSAQGIDDTTAKSGIAKKVDAAESDNSAFDWHASGAITLGLLGDAIVDVAPKIIPANELIQILDEQEKQASVLVNGPIANNPKAPKGQDREHFLDRGEYRVRVSAAPSNESMRKETEEKLADVYQNAPEPQKLVMTGALIRSSDINGKDKIADLADKAAGLPVKSENGQPDVQTMQEVIQSGHQLLQIAQQQVSELTQQLQSKQAEIDAKVQMNVNDNETKLAIAEIQKGIAGFEAEVQTVHEMLGVITDHLKIQADADNQQLDRDHAAGLQQSAQDAAAQQQQIAAEQSAEGQNA